MTDYRSRTVTDKETVATIRRLWQEGMTRAGISAVCGVGATTVKKYTRDMPRKIGRPKGKK